MGRGGRWRREEETKLMSCGRDFCESQCGERIQDETLDPPLTDNRPIRAEKQRSRYGRKVKVPMTWLPLDHVGSVSSI